MSEFTVNINKQAYPGTTRNLLPDDRLMLNTNSDLISQNMKKSSGNNAAAQSSNRSSTESLKESLPKISQLSKNKDNEGSALTKRLTTSGLTIGSELNKKPTIVRRMGEQLLRQSNFHQLRKIRMEQEKQKAKEEAKKKHDLQKMVSELQEVPDE